MAAAAGSRAFDRFARSQSLKRRVVWRVSRQRGAGLAPFRVSELLLCLIEPSLCERARAHAPQEGRASLTPPPCSRYRNAGVSK